MALVMMMVMMTISCTLWTGMAIPSEQIYGRWLSLVAGTYLFTQVEMGAIVDWRALFV